LEGLLRSIRDGLRTLDVDFFGISINHVDRQRSQVRYYSFAGDDGGWMTSKDQRVNQRILDFVQADKPTYRSDLHTDDSWEEREKVEAGWGPPIRSIIDVPFETGTFALNSRRAHAFGPEDQVLSMRNLRDGPQHADMLAALRQLGVPVDGLSLQFPSRDSGRFDRFYASGPFSLPEASEGGQLDEHPWVREVWETGASVVVPTERPETTGFAGWQNWEILEVPLPGWGSLGINRRDGGHFTSDMVRTVEAFANVVAVGGPASTGFQTSGGEGGAAQESRGEPASWGGALNRRRTYAVPECVSPEDLWLYSP